MKQSKSRLVRLRPETWARARALYPAPPGVKVKADDVVGCVLDLAERQREKEAVSGTE